MSLNLFDGLPNPLLEKPFAVLDFETTGLYPAVGDEIVEIGVIRVERGKLKKKGYSQLVNPGRDMDPAAAGVSGISNEMLASEPKFEDIADEFLKHLEGCVIVAHNAEFDMAFLQYKLVRMGRTQLANPVLDTLELARAQEDSGPNTLGMLANRLGIDGAHAHRALDDAKMAARVMLHYLEEYHRRGKDDLTKIPGYRHSYQFSIDGPGRDEEHSFQRIVERIRAAIEVRSVLEIQYQGGSGKSIRRITPKWIKGMHVTAKCHQRKEERTFRLDRIMEAVPVEATPEEIAAMDADTPRDGQGSPSGAQGELQL